MLKRYFVFILISLFFLSSKVSAQDSDQLFGFAEHLYNQGEYYRSVTEYQRFIFLYPQDSRVETARFQIGACYFAGEEWDSAEKAWQTALATPVSEQLRQQILYKLAVCSYKQEQYTLCRNYLERLRQEFPQSLLLLDNRKLEAASFIEQDDWAGAVNTFQQTDFPQKSALISIAEKEKGLPLKSPGLASVLSMVLPGAGQLYAGRIQDAAMSFMLNGLFIWGITEAYSNDKKVTAGILLFFETGWYLGNIYSAANSAHKYNQELKKTQREEIKNNLNLKLSLFPEGGGGLGVCYRF
ncbi:MAG: tetratricopeptide repeat protein [Candidatus Schekmanbacteria bacterium]|nr:tetratricopeptide repeat protein [Candidatus Schekmanbacteria bacterium]